MRRFKERRFWFNMLFSYLVIALLCFTLYMAFVLVSSYRLARAGYELEVSRKAARLEALLNEKNGVASEICDRINYSTAFTDVYLALVNGRSLVPSDIKEASTGVINAYVRNVAKGIDDVVLFVDGQDTALAASGVVQLSRPFSHRAFPDMEATVSSIGDLLDLDTLKATFNTRNLIYMAPFRYQGGMERGVIVVSFNLDRFLVDLRQIVDQDGFRLLFNGIPILDSSQNLVEEAVTEVISDRTLPGLSLELYSPLFSFSQALRDQRLMTSVCVGLVFYVVIIAMAVFFAVRHYRPIKMISSIVPGASERIGDDEVEAMIASLKDIVVGYDEYKNRLGAIAPLLENGMLHELMSGNSEVSGTYAGRYLGFSKPYYFVIAVNLESKDGSDVDSFGEMLSRMKAAFSHDERTLNFYSRDELNCFVNVNCDEEEGQDALVSSLYAFLAGGLSSQALLTFGVDRMRTDLGDFTDACNAALGALDYMLVRGKGDVYYSEEVEDDDVDYFIPANYELVLARAVRSGSGASDELDGLLKVNLMKHNLNAHAVRDFSNELYYDIVKTVRSLELDVETARADADSTVEDVVDFYKAQLDRVASQYAESLKSASSDVYEELDAFVEASYADSGLSLTMLCDRFHLSAKSITSYYYRHYGMTYLKHVKRLRIEKAKELLRRSDDPIDSIAQAVGYTNTLSFRRNFKEETGLTPSDWRLENVE